MDPNRVLHLSLIARNAGQRSSQLAGIKDEIAAMRFDAVCTLRLVIYDNQNRKNLALATGAAFMGGGETDDGETINC